MVKILTGGGYGSAKHVEARKGKQEPVSHKGNPGGVSQQGLATQFKKEPITSGKGYEPKPTGSTGVANAQKGHEGVGPGGGGRTIYKSGSQSPTPEPREMPKGRDTLAEFGKDIPGRR